MERIRDGESGALGELLDRHWHALVSFAVGIVGQDDDAEDIVQETFVRVWKHRARWHPTGKAVAYLYRVTRNLALNAVRDRRAADQRELRATETFVFSGMPPTPAEEFGTRALRQEIEAAVSALPERRQEIFVLSRFHGLSHAEIADALDLSPQTVSNQMSSALAQLRNLLSHRLDL